MISKWKQLLSIVTVCVFSLVPAIATAQTSGGTIAGSVTDVSGALVENAAIHAVGADTGTVYDAVSTSSGTFRFPQMQLGRYNLTITAAGFKALQLTGILVTTGNVSPAEAHLQTGGNTETVTVNEDAPVVETENSEVSNTVSSRQIVDLPLSLGGQGALRSVEAFIFLAPGTVGPGTAGSTSGAFQSKTAGGQQFGTDELLDGISVRREDSNSAFDEHAPSIEALTELKVTTSIIPASEGRTTGGINNFTTKSGTNSYHGTAYEFFRNEDLDANSYFNKLNIAKASPANFATTFANNQRQADKQNDFGGTVGGPIVIPHLYNGRDKTFGFFSFEQYRQSNGGTSVSDIPTPAVRGGDFSAQLTNTPDGNFIDCNGRQIFRGEILDPATTSTIFNPNGQSAGVGAVVPCRTPFAGNIIPTSRFSAVANRVLAFYPLPNTGAPGQLTRNYVYSTAFPRLNTVYSIRIDHSLSEKSKIFVTYTDRDNAIVNGHPPYPGPGGAVQLQNAFAKYLRVGSDYSFSPRSFNHLVAGLTRLYQINFANSLGFTPDFDSLLGITGASGVDFPAFSFGNSNYVNYNGVGYNNNDIQPVNAFQVTDTYTLILGRHSLSFGLDFRKDQYSNVNNGQNSGSFNFAPFQTSGGLNDSLSGDSFASLLLGRPQSAGLAVQTQAPRIGQAYYAGFIQDDFKVTQNLLLNLGVRYDVDTPRNEAHGNFSNFSPTTPNAGAGGIPGALVFAGTTIPSGVTPFNGRIGGTGYFAQIYKKDIAPRIGFAFAPPNSGGKTSIRGGFGIYYGPLDYADFGGGQQFGFTATPNFTSPDNFTQAFCNRAPTVTGSTVCNTPNGLDQGFPGYTSTLNLDPTQQNGQDLGNEFNGEYTAPGYGRPAAVYNWGAQVQQELATDLILTLGYIGTTGTHLHSDLAQVNDLNPSFYSLGNNLTTSQTSNTPGFRSPYAGFSGTLAQSLRPFPQYLNINTSGGSENLGHSSYNALTAKLERRFHNGLNLLASYTWSKTLTDADSTLPNFAAFSGGAGTIQNPYNLKGEKALSFQDVPQNFVVSYVYELPLGKGKKFLNHGAAVNAVVGGFQVGGIQRYLSGTPVAFSCTPEGAPASQACNRYNIDPNFINRGPSATSDDPTLRQAFNPNAFHDPTHDSGGYSLGTSPRVNGAFRSPIYKNEDFSITKHLFDLGEYGNLQLHVDIFNAFNRHIFNAPVTNVTATNFGSTQGSFGPTTRQFVLRYSF